jgi:hypothetical protein
MNENEVFKKNIERWSLYYPEEAQKVQNLECNRIISAETNGVQNIYQLMDGMQIFFHKPSDPIEEAREWFSNLDLSNYTYLYVYGVGLGYYYDVLKDWLKGQNHTLIFLEDDREVIHRLFETDRGTQILHDPKVRLVHVEKTNLEILQQVVQTYWRGPLKLSSLMFYEKAFPEFIKMLNSNLAFWLNFYRATNSEYEHFGSHFYMNFFDNLFRLPTSYRGSELFGKFKNIPAIISGAGPSLDKNLSVLENLANKAIIFAGGTSLNAVNSNGFIPHFGVGLDPHYEQVSRLIMNTAYEIPFLFRGRINHKALDIVQGPTVYVTGAGGFSTADWVENELGIPGTYVDEGFNVVNFSLSLALAMGCNPIIFVGLDLAYSGNNSYQSGVISHPIHDRKVAFRTKTGFDELLVQKDIYGNPVQTLWKWVSESLWLGQLVDRYPGTMFVNATEGGIGIPRVPNVPLAEVANDLLQYDSDLKTRIFGEIQNATMPESVTEESIEKLIHEMIESLKRCNQLCQALFSANISLYTSYGEGREGENTAKKSNDDLHDKLKSEIGYKYLLEKFHTYFIDSSIQQEERIRFDENLTSLQKKMLSAQIKVALYDFLTRAAIESSKFAEYALKNIYKQLVLDSSKQGKKFIEEGLDYSLEKNMLKIVDPDLHLAYEESFENDLVTVKETYSSGHKKLEQTFLAGVLHGPCRFYAENGQLLAETWFINGAREGKSQLYYLSGALYAIEQYKEGKLQGKQIYYYPQGNLKSEFFYENGLLNGTVNLYYPNGHKKRVIYFIHGKRNGLEEMWTPEGHLIVAATYKNNLPLGVARTWHKNGKIGQEITYDEHSKVVSIKQWDEEGVLLNLKVDYFDALSKQTSHLTGSLENVCNHLESLAPDISSESEYLKNQFDELKSKIEGLHVLSDKLLDETGLKNEEVKEPIWKSPSIQRELQRQLEQIVKKMTNEISTIQQLTKDIETSKNPPKSEDRKENER